MIKSFVYKIKKHCNETVYSSLKQQFGFLIIWILPEWFKFLFLAHTEEVFDKQFID